MVVSSLLMASMLGVDSVLEQTNKETRMANKLMRSSDEPKHDEDVGVIVGRFQVHELHQAHIDLISTVCAKHSKVILFLGLSPLKSTKTNPLDFESRMKMIREKFPDVIIMYIGDMSSDSEWSKKLDKQISDMTGANQSVILYGSRDSFLSRYSGHYKVRELVPEVIVSGTEVRKSISRKVMNTPDFRAGAIWATFQGYDSAIPTVDIAIFNDDCTKLLMARKPNESKIRFVGGFATPDSQSFEEDAAREAKEETGGSTEFSPMVYVGSAKIDDWRYRSESSKIKTMFFACKVMWGNPKASDDIEHLEWVDVKKLDEKMVVEEHHVLLQILGKSFTKIIGNLK